MGTDSAVVWQGDVRPATLNRDIWKLHKHQVNRYWHRVVSIKKQYQSKRVQWWSSLHFLMWYCWSGAVEQSIGEARGSHWLGWLRQREHDLLLLQPRVQHQWIAARKSFPLVDAGDTHRCIAQVFVKVHDQPLWKQELQNISSTCPAYDIRRMQT